MEWKNDYMTGIMDIDNQHEKLVGMITRLQNSIEEDIVTEETGKVLKELVEYTRYHFSKEEEIMLQIGYPKHDYHKGLHKGLIDKVVTILLRIKEGKSFTSLDLIEFLKSWLINHILREDLKIGAFLTSKNVAAKKDLIAYK